MNDALTAQLLRDELSRRPELRETLELYRALLAARAAAAAPAVPALAAEAARDRLARGEPLLDAAAFAADWRALAQTLAAVCAAAAEHRPGEAEALRALAGLADDEEELRAAVADHLARTVHPARRPAGAASAAATLLDFVLNHALHPALAAYADAWLPLVSDETWYRSYCPICGGAADFAALLAGGGTRRLLCARCDAEWTAPRGVCPFCGESAPGRLGYFPAGPDGIYRLYTCETCRRYLKTIDLRELARPIHLPVERVLTVGMDLAAQGAGYRSG